ncbi:GNAT family N-acetyltransferase [Dactylosporangium matsuzakiense]|uniref:N-acetyltransferase domain-containing protein n=1 Tax=Dactylosporangium matsuzakiense TaxID=53360 RepID=A0A9W6KTS2_9ACTN|nr:GNAT family N-acetyltransferase [Dactylosporangium matsuzakiense]UWZ48554.1 hypothetical protein Dmats_20395 [Dactylosporangium matsuzakiense]GLL06381.1 hypothetical protein GCM10017581_081310 [Dactylosporangium matsuzakiense]
MWWFRRRQPPRAVYGVQWRDLGVDARDDLIDLAAACAVADGARRAEPTGGWAGLEGFAGDRLVAGVVVHPSPRSRTIEGHVHPQWRGRGIGGAMLDWALERGGVSLEIPVLTPAAERLAESRGLRRVAALEHLGRPPDHPVELAPVPAGITFTDWVDDDGYDVYAESFAELPANPFTYLEDPDRSRWTWRSLIYAQGLVPERSLLARDAEGWAVGLVGCDDEGPFHFGTVPQWRGRGLGLAMLTEAISRVPPAPDRTEPWELRVSADNTAAVRLLRRAGYESDAREGHFERPHR